MAKFKIVNYQGIKIDSWTAKDLVGLHQFMDAVEFHKLFED